MAIIDEVRRRAAQARFEAERLVRINRTQTRISALQGQLNAGATQLGAIALDLIGRGELAHPELGGLSDQLLALRAQIEALDAEVRAIRAEVFTEEPTSITCPSCGTVSAPDGRFCRNCGAPLQAGAQTAQTPHVVQYAPAPAEEPVTSEPDIICERCAATNPPGMRFCVHCGTRLPIGTAGPAAQAWSAGSSSGSSTGMAWSAAAPQGTPSTRSASRQAPTVRMPTLDSALVSGSLSADAQHPGSSAEADVVGAPTQESSAEAFTTGPESAPTPNLNAATGVPRAERQETDSPAPSAEAAPATLPLRGDSGGTPPGGASADVTPQAPDQATVASTITQSVPVCPACGEPVVEGAAFCVTCGTRVIPG